MSNFNMSDFAGELFGQNKEVSKMKNVKIWIATDDGIDKVYRNFTNKEFNKIKKQSVKTNNDGSLVMNNGDIVKEIK